MGDHSREPVVIRMALSLRIAWCVLGVGALVAAAVTTGADLSLLTLMTFFGAVCVVIGLRPKVVVGEDSVEIVNVIDHHKIPREDVREFATTKWRTVRCFTRTGQSYPVAVLQWRVYDWLFPNVSDLRHQITTLNEAVQQS